MAKNHDYESGYQDGRNNMPKDAHNLDYKRGYGSGKQAYDFWNDKELYPDLLNDLDTNYSPRPATSSTDGSLTLGTMFFGSIALTLLAWAFVGLMLFLLWIGGSAGSFFFNLVFYGALWGGIGFVVVMTVAGIAMAIHEKLPQRNSDTPQSAQSNSVSQGDEPFYKKYPPADVLQNRQRKQK